MSDAKVWTIDEVKMYLPNVRVRNLGAIHDGKVRGRMNEVATVYWDDRGYKLSSCWAWETIVHCLNEGRPLQL
jgi:hypothetical protein